MSSRTDDPPTPPRDPTASLLARKLRLATWITGNVGRPGPRDAAAFCRMARERCEVGRAADAWEARKKEALAAHAEQWGASGLPGMLEAMAGGAPRPRGTDLIRWWKENGRGGSGGGSTTAEVRVLGDQAAAEPAGQPAQEQSSGEGAGVEDEQSEHHDEGGSE